MDEKENALKTIAKGASFVYLGMFFSKLFTYLYRIIVARIGPTEYGLLSLGLAVVSMVMYVPLLGMDQGIVRYVAYYLGIKDNQRIKGTITSALKISTPLAIIFSLTLFLSAETISTIILQQPELKLIIQILALSIPFYTISTIYLSIMKAYKRMDFWILIKNILENFFKVVITFCLIILGYGVIGAAIGYTISLIISFIIAILIVESKLVPIFKSKIISIKPTKELLSYSWPVMFHIIIGQILGWTDTLMIGFFKNPLEVGIYNAALPTAQIMTIVSTGIMALFVPALTDLYSKKKKQELILVYKTSTKWIYYLIIYILVIFITFSKEILSILFGPEYVQGALSFSILTVAFFIYSLLSPPTALLKVINKTKFMMLNTIICTTLNVILNYALIPRYGMEGGAIATAISIIIWSLLGLIEAQYLIKINPFKNKMVHMTMIGIFLIIFLFITKDYLGIEIIQIIKSMALTGIIYLFLLKYLDVFDKEDKNIITEIIKKIKREN